MACFVAILPICSAIYIFKYIIYHSKLFDKLHSLYYVCLINYGLSEPLLWDSGMADILRESVILSTGLLFIFIINHWSSLILVDELTSPTRRTVVRLLYRFSRISLYILPPTPTTNHSGGEAGLAAAGLGTALRRATRPAHPPVLSSLNQSQPFIPPRGGTHSHYPSSLEF